MLAIQLSPQLSQVVRRMKEMSLNEKETAYAMKGWISSQSLLHVESEAITSAFHLSAKTAKKEPKEPYSQWRP
ncbi:hypothetical protein GK047_24380 [Paenibacillus sp. SYP-B3998]|uniref:Uncharacterized protein n=1 Tax=Paenibacillus sp. SYP-B3998 TaxID=2678564 RepID=A0A6G4A654_9BACL|nr:hypothetical protein [Paenibacillus sp. SYP-B3998]NEW09117.1 hypothetical protein [Paenibacillus sp. SYP-B3998]